VLDSTKEVKNTDWHRTYGDDTLCGGVAKQRFASGAHVTLPGSEDNDANDDDDDECIARQLRVLVLSMLARQLDVSAD